MRRLRHRVVNNCRVRRLPSGALEVTRKLDRPLGGYAYQATKRWCTSEAVVGRELVRFTCHERDLERKTALLNGLAQLASATRVTAPERPALQAPSVPSSGGTDLPPADQLLALGQRAHALMESRQARGYAALSAALGEPERVLRHAIVAYARHLRWEGAHEA